MEKFYVNISKAMYACKEDAKACLKGNTAREIGRDKMTFLERFIDVQEYLNLMTCGHTCCNLFRFEPDKKYSYTYKNHQYHDYAYYRKGDKKGGLKLQFKKDGYFTGSQVITVDVDKTRFDSVKDYISCLTVKPNCVYMSYSDGKEKGGVVSRRFHMSYIFNTILDKEEFLTASKCLSKMIEDDTDEELEDDCGTRISQYFNGCFYSKERYLLNINLYSYNNLYNSYFKDIINIIYNKDSSSILPVIGTSHTTTSYNDLENVTPLSYNERLTNDMARLPYEEFMTQNRHRYRYFYRKEKDEWIDDLYQFIDDDYFSLYWNVNVLKDGQRRRKMIYERMCLRRVLDPNVDIDTIMFNAYEDIHRFVDNSDGELNVDYIIKNALSAFRYSVDEIKDKYSNNIAYLQSRKPKSGIILKGHLNYDIASRNTLFKEIRYSLIDDVYDLSITVKENKKLIEDNLMNISMASLYNYCYARGIKVKLTKSEKESLFKSVYNPFITNAQNIENLRKHGLNMSKRTMQRWLEAHPEWKYTIPVSACTSICHSSYANDIGALKVG